MKATAPTRIRSSSLRLVTSLSALLLLSAPELATAQAAPKKSAQTVQITDKAREHFRAGVALPDAFVEHAIVPDDPLQLPADEIDENRDRLVARWTEIVVR